MICVICGRDAEPICGTEDNAVIPNVCRKCGERIILNHAALYIPSANARLKPMKSMTRDIYDYVAVHPGQTSDEISVALSADLHMVRAILPRLRERDMLFAIAVRSNVNKWYCTDISTY